MEREKRKGQARGKQAQTMDNRMSQRSGYGIEELNLTEFLLGALTDVSPRVKTVEYSDSIPDKATGRQIFRSVTVTAADKWGLPTWQDIDVLLALQKLTYDKNRFHDRNVCFSIYELRLLLHWPDDGRSNARIKLALLRLLGLTIAFENSWRRRGKWVTMPAFHVLNNVNLTNTAEHFDADARQMLQWNDVIVESVLAGNYRKLDWNFYISLKLPLAKRLYRFLSKRFWQRHQWAFDLTTFCQEKIGMSRRYPVHRYKDKLAPAIKELEERGFLVPLPIKQRFTKVRCAVYQVHFRKQAKRADQKDQLSSSPLEQQLRDLGVRNCVGELVATHPKAKIERAIENYHARLARRERIDVGFLIRDIQSGEGFSFPAGYVSLAERRARENEKHARQTKIKQEKRRRDLLEVEQAAKDRACVEQFLRSLGTDREREEFEKAAFAVNSKLRRLHDQLTSRNQKHNRIAVLKRYIDRIETHQTDVVPG